VSGDGPFGPTPGGAGGGFGGGGSLTPDAVVEQAVQLRAGGRPTDALSLVERGLLTVPDHAMLLHVRAGLLMETHRVEEAVAPAARAVELEPRDASFRVLLAMTQGGTGRIHEAIASYKAALTLDPGNGPAIEGLVEALRVENDTQAADAAYRAYFAAQKQPSPVAICAAAEFLLSTARPEQAARTLQSGIRMYPNETRILSVLPGTLNYIDGVAPEETLRAHVHCGARFAAALNLSRMTLRNTRDPEKRLRVGYMSPDFRRHSVAYFLEPLLEGHDRSRFEVFGYATFIPGNGRDDMTERLAAKCDAFHETTDLAGHTLAAKIAADGIDVLVDLAGWTGGCRPITMLRKPAPVVVSYLGYPNITGLPTVDARIVDAWTDPAGWGDDVLAGAKVERRIRLSRAMWCYVPPGDAPEVTAAPSTLGKPVTFASFNATKKISATAARFWAAAVNAVPGSRLLVKAYGLGDAFIAQKYREMLQRAGLDPARVELQAADRDVVTHLGRYAEVDIALDTYPYNGTTTTCEALWMGVPTVTLTGAAHCSRVGYSLLNAVGMGELSAPTPETAAGIAAEFARDTARLAALRATLRGRMDVSELRDARGLCAALEGAYRDLWIAHCRGGAGSPR